MAKFCQTYTFSQVFGFVPEVAISLKHHRRLPGRPASRFCLGFPGGQLSQRRLLRFKPDHAAAAATEVLIVRRALLALDGVGPDIGDAQRLGAIPDRPDRPERVICQVNTHSSADAPFQRNRDQALRLHRKFHRQGLQHFLAEPVHYQRHRLFLVHAP